MKKNIRKKVTTVREHPMRVPVSEKNPTGVTIRDRHLRRLEGTCLDEAEIASIFRKYDRKKVSYPTVGKLEHGNADKYDDEIAVWTDYFNKKFNADPPLDPDVVKELIDSESGFRADPRENKKAFGITQITPSTLKIVQDTNGEAKDFIFNKITRKDLKDPGIAIPIAVRWLFRKRVTAMNQLKRAPDHEELILEYKGLLKSDSEYKKAALKKYKEAMENLKNSLLLLVFGSLTSACQSTKAFDFETFQKPKGEVHIVHTDTDRVRQECLFLNAEGDNNWRHQYFMFVLNDKNEVIEIMKSTHTDEDFCRRLVRDIEKLLKAEARVKICVHDKLRKVQTEEDFNKRISFGPLGAHKVSHEGLTFDTICNSKKCVGDNSAWVSTCPGFPKQ